MLTLTKGYINSCVLCFSIVLFLPVMSWSQGAYKEVTVKDGGTIVGYVRLAGPTLNLPKFEITKNPEHCGTVKPTDRLIIGINRGVRNSIVSVEAISQGKKNPAYIKPTLNQRKCEYVPHVQVIRAGTPLEIVNSDGILHNVHAYLGEKNIRTVFNIAQPIKGQRTLVKQSSLSQPGLVVVTCDAGHPWMTGFVMLADHPYYAITNEEGKFELADVPPGTYTLKMWHEGFRLIGTEIENGKVKKYRFEDPYEVEKPISISPKQRVVVDFELVPRSETNN